MKRLLLLFIAVSVFACQPPSSDSSEQGSTTVSLFDGRTLSLWRVGDNIETKIKDGVLSLWRSDTTQSAIIWTQTPYSHFQLQTDFLLPPAHSSRIVIREGYEIVLNNDPNQQHPTGSIFEMARATWLDSLAVDDWNTLTIEAQGDHLKTYLNGQLVAETHNQQLSRGKIGLIPPPDGQQVQFRNMSLTLLPAIDVSPLMESQVRAMAADEDQLLFDGETLAGWQPIGDGSWTVEEGVIHGYSGEEGGFLVSENTYQNFYLKAKFKIAFEDNSGIFIRKPPTEEISLENSIECNVYDHNGYSFPYSTGSIATHARAFRDLIDYEEWNEMEIFAKDDHIVLYVNGNKSAEAHVPSTLVHPGSICLQGGIQLFSETKGPSDVYYKDIVIRNLDTSPVTEP